MKLKEALVHARRLLNENGIEDASLEVEILLRHALQLTRTQLYQQLDNELSKTNETSYFRLVERRRYGEPSAYITGHREFYGLDFYVDHHVLIPRPESELLVDKALEIASSQDIASLVDVGTGCGVIAISLAKNLTRTRIYATDISPAALEIARENCRRHGVLDRIELLHGDTLEPLPGPVDLIIANLPYVKKAEVPDNGPLSFEPRLALDGGRDGLSVIEKLCRQAEEKLSARGCMLLEMGEGQADTVIDIIQEVFTDSRIEITSDYAGIERVVAVYLT